MKKLIILCVYVLAALPHIAFAQAMCEPPPPGEYILKVERTSGTCSFPRFYGVTLNGEEFFKFGDENCEHDVKSFSSGCAQEVYTMCPFTYQDANHIGSIHRGTAVKVGRILSKGEYGYNDAPTSFEAMVGEQTIILMTEEVGVICAAKFNVSLIQVGSTK